MKYVVTAWARDEEFCEEWDTLEEAKERQHFLEAEMPGVRARIDEVEDYD